MTILCCVSKSFADRLMSRGNNAANQGSSRRAGGGRLPAWHGDQVLESVRGSPQTRGPQPAQVNAL